MQEKKAEIEGLTQDDSEEKEKDNEPSLDEILEKTKQAMVVEATINDEATKMAVGAYSEDVVYNIPRLTGIGKEDWGVVCDKMPGGCPYKGRKHIHTLGIGINGAIKIANAYGGIKITAQNPEIKEITFLDKGKMVSMAFWTSSVTGINTKTENELTLPYQHPAMKKTKTGWDDKAKKTLYGYEFDEYGAQICTSKNIRNTILKLIPDNVQAKWIREYSEDTPASEPEKPKEKKEETKKQEAKDKPKDKSKEDNVIELQEETLEWALDYLENKIKALRHMENWYAKHSAWISSLPSEEKAQIVDAYNTKQAEFAAQQEGSSEDESETDQGDDTPKPATVAQDATIKKLAKNKGMTVADLGKFCLETTGVEETADMTYEQAAMVIAEIQK